ncbi:MAG: hypothetical protein M3179_10380 [Actinomycetota bacterium]|nr:hypothetical protein [Actinomycetota bacterium]
MSQADTATAATTESAPGADTTEITLGETCDVCGRVVDDPNDAHRAELTVSGAMCPSPMVFHKACYEKASSMWQPDPDSYCTVDPEYPETGQWTLPEESSDPAPDNGGD